MSDLLKFTFSVAALLSAAALITSCNKSSDSAPAAATTESVELQTKMLLQSLNIVHVQNECAVIPAGIYTQDGQSFSVRTENETQVFNFLGRDFQVNGRRYDLREPRKGDGPDTKKDSYMATCHKQQTRLTILKNGVEEIVSFYIIPSGVDVEITAVTQEESKTDSGVKKSPKPEAPVIFVREGTKISI